MRSALLFAVLLAAPENVKVSFVSDEAAAVLHILDKRARREEITARDWASLFATEGYVRLAKREHSMQREFEDDAFRAFVMSDALLARREELHATLASWTARDISGAAKLALAYLPANAKIEAKVYPVIKPKSNSFVFETDRDPAVFVYLEALPQPVFEAIVAHELHHIGYASSCTREDAPNRDLRRWVSAFGEGLATLAASGGASPPRLKSDALEEWNRQMARLPENFAIAQSFLTRVARGELDADAQRKEGMALFGIVGPWYTVGWHMAVTIEQELGHETLLRATCDQSLLLATYNEAAKQRNARTGQSLPMWDETVVGSR
ncbi:MAG TPA: DUF5700 domain-containing putative Zn-dependent protease [Thermoanaerobaculia bacterium]|nr:DUF5700 domain-containing putative Zn-dependent protease [Thermoanaerobaculia bacterium]